MFRIVDFSNWELYSGFSEGSGRSEKHWLHSANDTIGLFKYPKVDPSTSSNTYEHISEHLAHQIGDILDVDTAVVDIGMYQGRIGSLSYLVNDAIEELREGIWFISKIHPHYNPDSMQDPDSGEYYSLKHLIEVMDAPVINYFWLSMMLFDFLIGNNDRHQSNWAFLSPIEDRGKQVLRVRPCPLYDNGSSLCCYIKDCQVNQYLGRDQTMFNALIDTKSRSIIRIDGHHKKRPSHSDVVRHLLKHCLTSMEIADMFLEKMTPAIIDDLIAKYPDDLVSAGRKELLIKFLSGKIELLKKIREEIK